MRDPIITNINEYVDVKDSNTITSLLKINNPKDDLPEGYNFYVNTASSKKEFLYETSNNTYKISLTNPDNLKLPKEDSDIMHKWLISKSIAGLKYNYEALIFIYNMENDPILDNVKLVNKYVNTRS